MRKIVQFFGRGLFKLSSMGLKKSHPFSRYTMYSRIAEAFPEPGFGGAALSISHSTHLFDIVGAKPDSVVEADYPEVNILDLPFGDEEFDLVVSDQVFEHIEGNPQRAFDETMRVLRPGGYVLHTTCFLLPYHGPGDYWRYTPEGLSYLARDASKIICAGGWGNPCQPLVNLLGLTRVGVPKAKWHPVHILATMNRPSYQSVVWILAQK